MAKKSDVIYATHARHKDNFNVYFSGALVQREYDGRGDRVLRWQLARIDALSTEDAARAEDHGAEATTYHDIPDFTDEELAVDGDITDQLD